MATVPHVTSGLGLRKFQADGFLLTRVYVGMGRYYCTAVYASVISPFALTNFISRALTLFYDIYVINPSFGGQLHLSACYQSHIVEKIYVNVGLSPYLSNATS